MKLRKLLIVACALLMLMGCTGKTTKKGGEGTCNHVSVG